MNHQEAFDALQRALSTALVLRYPNFSSECILETDASLNGLGTILSHQGEDGKICLNCLSKPLLMPIQKIHVQLQLSQAGAASVKMAHYREVWGLFIGLVVPSLHGYQPTCLQSRK